MGTQRQVAYLKVGVSPPPNIEFMLVEIGSLGSQTEKNSRATRACFPKENIFIEICSKH